MCKRKGSTHRPYGLLHPLLVPKGPWLLLSLNFITDLPLNNGKDSIFVVVNRLTKMAQFIPCTKTVIGEETAKLFFDNIYCIHGLPNDIVLYRGTQFTSNFWRGLFQLLSMKINLFVVYHLQIDGQTKRVNQVLKQYLHCIVNYQQDNWTYFLLLVEFAYNNTMYLSIKQIPFFSNYGYHPRANYFQVKDAGSLVAKDLVAHFTTIHDELAFQFYKVQTALKTMQIALGKYTRIFTL